MHLLLIAECLLVFGLRLSFALVCYDNGAGKIEPTRVNKTRNGGEFKYCVVSVRNPLKASQSGTTALFGVGPANDSVDVYDQVFAMNIAGGKTDPGHYKVLTMCMFEEYHVVDSEFLFRCFCNWDSCNKANNLPNFLTRLKRHEVQSHDDTEENLMELAKKRNIRRWSNRV